MTSRKIETTTEQWGKLPTIPGVHDILSTNLHARRFTLSLPNRIDSKNGNPIVLILHYGGDPTPYYGRPLIETLYQPNWHELDAIMIAPESSGGSWADETNEGYAIELFKTIVRTYKADKKRTLVTGYSAGALGSCHYSHHYPELFSAAIPIAGFPTQYKPLPIPARYLLSEEDELFPLSQFQEMISSIKDTVSTEIVSVNARSHYDISAFSNAVSESLPWIKSFWT